MRFTSGGKVVLTVIRVSGGSRSIIGQSVTVPNLTHRPGSDVAFRVRIQGSNPTTIAAKAWAAAKSQPSAWGLVAEDAAPDFAAAAQDEWLVGPSLRCCIVIDERARQIRLRPGSRLATR